MISAAFTLPSELMSPLRAGVLNFSGFVIICMSLIRSAEVIIPSQLISYSSELNPGRVTAAVTDTVDEITVSAAEETDDTAVVPAEVTAGGAVTGFSVVVTGFTAEVTADPVFVTGFPVVVTGFTAEVTADAVFVTGFPVVVTGFTAEVTAVVPADVTDVTGVGAEVTELDTGGFALTSIFFIFSGVRS